MTKNFCSVHHFYYEGSECPLCQQERFKAMAEKYVKKTVDEQPKAKLKQKTDREITENDLSKLIAKFNGNQR